MLQHTFNVRGNALSDRLEIRAPAKLFEVLWLGRLWQKIPFQPGVGVDEFGNNQHVNIDVGFSGKNPGQCFRIDINLTVSRFLWAIDKQPDISSVARG